MSAFTRTIVPAVLNATDVFGLVHKTGRSGFLGGLETGTDPAGLVSNTAGGYQANQNKKIQEQLQQAQQAATPVPPAAVSPIYAPPPAAVSPLPKKTLLGQ